MTARTRSPLTEPPLRTPGQSLDEEIQRLIDDQGTPYIAVVMCSLILSIMEWARWYWELPYSPIGFTVVSVALVLYFIVHLKKIKRKLHALKLGRDGERFVGQKLEELRQDGYKIFHDIVGEGYNIDHVIVSTKGIFTVETKTHSKPLKGKTDIWVKKDSISINGFNNEHILIQLAAQTRSLEAIIQKNMGRKIKVNAIALFPGWYIHNEFAAKNCWVLNPKRLNWALQKSKCCLSKEEVSDISENLSEYFRTLNTNGHHP